MRLIAPSSRDIFIGDVSGVATLAHDRIREAVLADLEPPRLRALHAAVARALEVQQPNERDANAGQLAGHYEAAGLWESAVRHLRLAAAQAAARGVLRESMLFLERALGALAHLAETPERLGQLVDIGIELRDCLVPLGEVDRLGACLKEIEAVASRLTDERRRGLVAISVAHYAVMVGQPARAIVVGRQASEIAERLGDPALQLLCNFYVGRAYYSAGDFPAAAQAFRRNEGLGSDLVIERGGTNMPIALQSRVRLALCLGELGDFEEAMAVAKDVHRIAEQARHPISLPAVEATIGQLLVDQRLMEAASVALERAIALSDSRELAQFRPIAQSLLGYARAVSGRTAEGIALLRGAVDEATALRRHQRGLMIALFADALILDGQTAAAVRSAEQALEVTRQQGERGPEAAALHVLGNAHAALGDLARAESWYRAGLALAETLRMRPLVARVHLGLGRLQRRSGHVSASEESLDRATRMFADMGLDAWLAELRAATETCPSG